MMDTFWHFYYAHPFWFWTLAVLAWLWFLKWHDEAWRKHDRRRERKEKERIEAIADAVARKLRKS